LKLSTAAPAGVPAVREIGERAGKERARERELERAEREQRESRERESRQIRGGWGKREEEGEKHLDF
jgi:hypothetical protein